MRKEKMLELKKLINDFKIVKQEKLEEVPSFLSLEKYHYTLANNQSFKREKLLKNKASGSAAIVMPVTKDGNVLFVVQPRVFMDSGVSVELPAGYIEPGEDAILSAKRELLEETGFSSEHFIHLGGYYQDQGVSEAYNEAFLALDSVYLSKQKLDKDEFISILECTIKEAYELIDLGYIKDINTLYTMKCAETFLKRRRMK